MKQLLNTYKAYSIGGAIVWVVLLLVVATRGGSTTTHNVLLVFPGWWIGWLSATIARSVYPR